jgi:8-oxo-dGTP diphosphatase
VESVLSSDARFVASFWPYGRSPEYVRERIRALPSAAIRRNGRLVAWSLTHDDGSMGFLHVLDEWRGRGFARALTTALALRLLRLGLRPFLYIVQTNTPSIRLTESMGFTRAGSYGWFGSLPRRRPSRRGKSGRLPSGPSAR